MTLPNNTLFWPFKLEDPRPYQIEGWRAMRNFTKKWLNDALKHIPWVEWETLMSIVMATGSGKTYTTGVHIRNMFDGRDILERIQKKEIPLNILILNDRTSLIDQLEKANIEGKWWYEPHFGADILDHAHIKVFHSRADKKQILNKNNEIVEIDGEDNIQEFGQGKKDNIYFSTFQSTNKFADEGLVFDVIMIDEAHHLKASSYKSVVQEYVDKYEIKNWRKPLIIPMSATPDDLMNSVDPVVNFTLAQYLDSPYSPEVDYHLVTSTDFTNDNLEFVNTEIQRIQSISDIRERVKEIKTLKWYIEEHLAQFGWLKELTQDMISRVMDNAGSLDHTIIFAPSINDVDAITAQINELTGDSHTAVWFHSKIDEADKTILDWYESGKHKIIVAVDKLNEGIDMPKTRNVIFRRWTNSPTTFQQQFGRGLRGKRVSFYDYTGMMTNFSWIGDISNELKQIQEKDEQNQLVENTTNIKPPHIRKGINMLLGDVNEIPNTQKITIMQILKWINNLSNEISSQMNKDESIEYLLSSLNEEWIKDNIQLISMWINEFYWKYGEKIIENILWEKPLKRTITLVKLGEIIFGENLAQNIKQTLIFNGLSSKEELSGNPSKVQKILWLKIIKLLLWKTLPHATISDVEELGKLINLPSFTGTNQIMIEIEYCVWILKNIQHNEDLIGCLKRLKKEKNPLLSKSKIGKFLWKNLQSVTLWTLQEIVEKLSTSSNKN